MDWITFLKSWLVVSLQERIDNAIERPLARVAIVLVFEEGDVSRIVIRYALITKRMEINVEAPEVSRGSAAVIEAFREISLKPVRVLTELISEIFALQGNG